LFFPLSMAVYESPVRLFSTGRELLLKGVVTICDPIDSSLGVNFEAAPEIFTGTLHQTRPQRITFDIAAALQ
jgi:hypothetical protein